MPSATRQPYQLNAAVKLPATVRRARIKPDAFGKQADYRPGARERPVRAGGGGHGLRVGRISEHRRCSEDDGLAWTSRQAGR